MWNYEKRLQYPVNITQTNPKIAQVIISQFGGPDGELAASMRYLSQRYTMPDNRVQGVLTDIGREAPEMFQEAANRHDRFSLQRMLSRRCFCNRIAPFKRKQVQIYVDVLSVVNHHFVK